MSERTCSVDGCDRPHASRGLCGPHYQKERAQPGWQPLPQPTPEERFWSKVEIRGADDCWLWTAAHHGDGYGLHRHLGRTSRAHRVAYELTIGPIPEGLMLDHLCRVRDCVNPAHLEPVTNRENILRSEITPPGINARKTHCIRGHEFTPDNTLVRRDGAKRECRACIRERRP